MKVHELLHRITFDDNTSNAVVIFTGRHSYEVFSEECLDFLTIWKKMSKNTRIAFGLLGLKICAMN